MQTKCKWNISQQANQGWKKGDVGNAALWRVGGGSAEGRWRVGVNAKASEGGGMGWKKSSSTIIFILKQSKNMIIPKKIRIFATY